MPKDHGTRRPLGAIVVVVALAASLAGCEMFDRRTEMESAVYARQVPAYPSATFETSTNDGASEGMGGREVARVRSWTYRVADPVDTVVAFYAEKLPGATRTSEGRDAIFTIKPKTAGPDESVSVRVGSGRVVITEVTTPKGSQY